VVLITHLSSLLKIILKFLHPWRIIPKLKNKSWNLDCHRQTIMFSRQMLQNHNIINLKQHLQMKDLSRHRQILKKK
jgi:hypothetical protein